MGAAQCGDHGRPPTTNTVICRYSVPRPEAGSWPPELRLSPRRRCVHALAPRPMRRPCGAPREAWLRLRLTGPHPSLMGVQVGALHDSTARHRHRNAISRQPHRGARETVMSMTGHTFSTIGWPSARRDETLRPCTTFATADLKRPCCRPDGLRPHHPLGISGSPRRTARRPLGAKPAHARASPLFIPAGLARR